MIDNHTKLAIKHDKATVFADYSYKMASYGKDTVVIDLTSATDYLYIGFHKPINSLYINHLTKGLLESSIVLECYTDSGYTTITELSDDTLGLARSGFIKWSNPNVQSKHSVDGSELFWYRVKANDDRENLELAGVNLVFADDYELELEQPYIANSEFLSNQSSHVKIHAASRNEIIQYFRNKDYVKIDSNGVKQNINAWDLHDIEEVRQAAVYLAISKIYGNMSDSPDDIWASKSDMYLGKYGRAIQLASLSLDTNDDGVNDVTIENKQSFSVKHMKR